MGPHGVIMQFSVVITCYNQASFIQEAVKSALGQEYREKEIIVVDDGSTDGSIELIEHFGPAVTFVPLKRNAGPAEARNAGAAVARAAFLVFLDGDDLLLPCALQTYHRIVELKSPTLILGKMRWFEGTFCASDIGTVPDEVSVVEYENFMQKDRPYRASASSMVIARAAFNSVSGWTKGIFPMDDHDLLIKLGYSGRTVQILKPPTTGYRVHLSNTVHHIDRMTSNLHKLLKRERHALYPGAGRRRIYRHGILGGLLLFAIKNAMRNKFYGEAMKLVVRGWMMILIAAFLRGIAYVRGRRPVESLTVSQAESPNEEDGGGVAP